MKFRRVSLCAAAFTALLPLSLLTLSAQAPHQPPKPHHPWDDKSLSPDQRADMVIKEMTLDEKIQLVHGTGAQTWAQAMSLASTGWAFPTSTWPIRRWA